MAESDLTKQFVSGVRQDRLLLLTAGVLLLCLLPFFLPGLDYDFIWHYNMGLTTLIVMPTCIAWLWPRAKERLGPSECVFWRMLAGAFALWLAVKLSQWLLEGDYSVRPIALAQDIGHVGYYLVFFLALALIPARSPPPRALRSLRWVRSSGLLVLTFWLFCYFVLIPSQFQPQLYDSAVVSLLFYTVLDVALTAWLVGLAIFAARPRWRLIYWLMAALAALYLGLDALETWYAIKAPAWMDTHAAEALWYLPFFATLVIARARRYELGDAREPAKTEPAQEPGRFEYTSPVVLLAFVLPVIHALVELLGSHAHWEAHNMQSSVVLGSLVTFWALAIIESRSIRQVSFLAERQAEELSQLHIEQQVKGKSERLKARFLSNVSHELRTPMNGILGLSELLLTGELDKAQRRRVELLISSSVSLTKIINDILDYSRAQTGEMRIVARPFQLEETARTTLELMRVTAQEKGIEMRVEADPALPAWLNGDALRLQQVMVNLVSNAIKFSDEGRVTLCLSMLESDGKTALIGVEITDQGIGIDPDQAEYFFLPFSQADESSSRKHGGSGLGLAISKQLVELLGGEIGARNNSDGGATFWFRIPFIIGQEPADAPPEEPAAAPVANGESRVLLVEDEHTSQLVIGAQIASLGYPYDVAANGHEALSALEKTDYALILMDCDMPELDGLEATRRIRATEDTRGRSKTPIIALTAHVFEESRESSIEAGMDGFLAKPLSIDKLAAALEKWLQPQAGSRRDA